MTKKLLAICYEFAPATTPTAIRSAKLLTLLQEWEIDVVTVENCEPLTDRMKMHSVKSWVPDALLRMAARLKLDKFTEWLVWPDDKIFWVLPALFKAMALIRLHQPDVILVFMMPYAAGIIGLLLKQLTGLPVIFNLDDSLTCTDMHPEFPSRLHYQLSCWLENSYVRTADASIYVSEFNLETVRQRQPEADKGKLHLIRYGADETDFRRSLPRNQDKKFRMAYLGGMNGWHAFHLPLANQNPAKKLYRQWMQLGRHSLVALDYRSSSPVFAGKAIQEVLTKHTEWRGQICLEVFGNRYPEAVVTKLLKSQQIEEVVTVSGPVPNADAVRIAGEADLLFMTLPGRKDGSSGGRISAKTYEYLMTDRPILAALPPGENWDYLKDKPGVWLVAPDDVKSMAEIIALLADSKFKGKSLSFDRSEFRGELSYSARTAQLTQVLHQVSSHDGGVASVAREIPT